MSGIAEQIPARYWGLASLVLVALAWMAMFRYDDYGIDEGAARALLLNWAIVDQIAHPVAFAGAPDLRAFLFTILDIHWAGNLIAAKVLSLFVMLGVGLALYDWASKRISPEVALIGTGLLLIAPITVMQVDAIGKGPYLLLAFWLGCVFEGRYSSSQRDIPGDYFIALLAAALAVSLHPAGLALPAAIAWKHRTQARERKSRNLLIGLAVVAILFPIIRWGWPELNWLGNPLLTLADMLIGPQYETTDPSWGPGLLALGTALLVVALSFRKLADSVLSLSLVLAFVIGFLAPDGGWTLTTLALILYYGADLAIRLNRRLRFRSGLLGERGIVIALIILTATTFMVADRHIRYVARHDIYSPTDALIKRLAEEAADPDKPFRAASQWPGRTMLAIKRETFPLPPVAKSPEALLASIRGITHVAFDYRARRNRKLAHQFALLSADLETIAVLPGGVILRSRHPAEPRKKSEHKAK